MKAVLLAGGFGTRLSEETDLRPKPMVEIGGKPILWHIMKIYSTYGINEFVILLGYKGYYIKEYFANYFLHESDITIDLKDNKIEVLNNSSEPWKVTLLDTGLNSMTGGRIKRAQDFIGDEPFLLTYGDGVANINIDELLKFHKEHGKSMTMTSAQPDGRFGALELESNVVKSFKEKPRGDGSLINGGFFVLNPSVIDLIKDDNTVWEQDPLMALAEKKQLMAYKHSGTWQPMDTLRDKVYLERLWEAGNAPWKSW